MKSTYFRTFCRFQNKETEYLLTGKNREILLKSIKELEEGNCIQKELEDLADTIFAKRG